MAELDGDNIGAASSLYFCEPLARRSAAFLQSLLQVIFAYEGPECLRPWYLGVTCVILGLGCVYMVRDELCIRRENATRPLFSEVSSAPSPLVDAGCVHYCDHSFDPLSDDDLLPFDLCDRIRISREEADLQLLYSLAQPTAFPPDSGNDVCVFASADSLSSEDSYSLDFSFSPCLRDALSMTASDLIHEADGTFNPRVVLVAGYQQPLSRTAKDYVSVRDFSPLVAPPCVPNIVSCAVFDPFFPAVQFHSPLSRTAESFQSVRSFRPCPRASSPSAPIVTRCGITYHAEAVDAGPNNL
jgi:hypothetical protein